MGTILNYSIIVTSFDDEILNELHKIAKKNFKHLVSDVVDSRMNKIKSFFIAPDGSKYEFEDRAKYDKLRGAFLDQVKAYDFVEFVEVKFPDEEMNGAEIISDSNSIYNLEE